jgi:uncharacterized protein YcbK (DUF882 family)
MVTKKARTTSRMKPFLHLALLAIIVAPFTNSRAIASSTGAQPGPEYRLRFFHTHTNERIDIVYRRGDTYLPEALDRLDYYLRDWRTGEVHHYNPHLFDLLHDLLASVGEPNDEISVICGYRTPQTNELLRARHAHTGVAVHSLHMQAEAIDVRLPDLSTARLRDAALALHRGGVGYYQASNFVHVDTGRVRRW